MNIQFVFSVYAGRGLAGGDRIIPDLVDQTQRLGEAIKVFCESRQLQPIILFGGSPNATATARTLSRIIPDASLSVDTAFYEGCTFTHPQGLMSQIEHDAGANHNCVIVVLSQKDAEQLCYILMKNRGEFAFSEGPSLELQECEAAYASFNPPLVAILDTLPKGEQATA